MDKLIITVMIQSVVCLCIAILIFKISKDKEDVSEENSHLESIQEELLSKIDSLNREIDNAKRTIHNLNKEKSHIKNEYINNMNIKNKLIESLNKWVRKRDIKTGKFITKKQEK